MRKVIVRESTDEIADIRAYAVVVENGIDVGAYILGEPGLIIREADEVPEEVKPGTHCYDGTDFYLNPDYVPPVGPDLEQQVAALRQENAVLRSDLEDVLLLMAEIIAG